MAILPLTITPGPANVTFAASSATFGVRNTVPVWLGINTVAIIQTGLIGMGLGEMLFRYPAVSQGFKMAGILFMLYLAVRFIRSTALKDTKVKPLGYLDGVILQFLNFKFLMIPTIMYTQFIDPESSTWGQVLILGVGLILLNISSHAVWITAGKTLTNVFHSERAMKIQGYSFGGMLIAVSIWMLFS
jgi:threonine/homoserine/homoserine lactone efflux protein